MIDDFREGGEYSLADIKSTLKIGGGFLARGINVRGRYPNYDHVVLLSKDDGPYPDSWDGRVLKYCGEGLQGNQEFTRGNKVLNEQKAGGYPIYVFRKEKTEGGYTYLGEFDVSGNEQVSHENRKIIVFNLQRRPNS